LSVFYATIVVAKSLAEKELNVQSRKEVQTEQIALTQKLGRLTDLLIAVHIEEKIYKAKHTEIAFRRDEIHRILKDNNLADESFKDALGNVLTLASKSAEIFKSSKTDTKRQLTGFVFSNLEKEGPASRQPPCSSLKLC